jgi:RNA polymerase sigma factor (sigma-70 family)
MTWIGADVDAAQRQFLALVGDVRAELHRYCARMTGSIADGEDVVQETLARAFFELPQLAELPPLRAWLFRIAHNRCIDLARRYDRRMGEPLDEELEDPARSPDDQLEQRHAIELAVSRFLELPAAQRSCVILRDVLGYSTDETGAVLALSSLAVKAALHRGRVRLAELAAPPQKPDISPLVRRYADLFDARDWDGVRALLVEDVELDLVTRFKRRGRREVSTYFTNYASISGWRVVALPQNLIAMFASPEATTPSYVIALDIAPTGIARIRDYRYVPYIARDLDADR